MSPSFPSDKPQCQETSGFLFSHPCERGATTQCMRCQKSICLLHMRTLDGGEVACVMCARTADNGDENRELSNTSDEDDPSYYYEDYGYYGRDAWRGSGSSSSGSDPNDFTEADGESVRREDDASFEEDLGGS
ncbi:hypothetical protein COCOR_00231 [Corallococcus coralloides DSM 2259]|uniref:Uncharacterized protein n=1 Tax=Corallococcus coralloides (strain ATCC 25202 / DSM 2259 / NBRC 100086 / M2) TaxID=1144275 RepID=H8MWM1_CORCM|nr:hypothetical protein [Corallococcus coralloides]AFE03358.1 hypothetical protein COCOR_00231 [Corallococcus coralloides DSM 2259]